MNTTSVVRVGSGRGFVVEHGHDRLVVTAAHCLPHLPPCYSFSALEERTYQNLLRPLGGHPSVWSECLFADPIGDIAILGPPHGQELYDQSRAYEELVQGATPMAIAEASSDGPGWLLSIECEWFRCGVRRHQNGPLWLYDSTVNIVGGMSGSPIIDDAGAAIGVMCTSAKKGEAEVSIERGPNPILTHNLPAWFFVPSSRPSK